MTTTGLRPLLSLLFLGLGVILLCDVSSSIAIAPSTFGTAIARAGKISNQLKVSSRTRIPNHIHAYINSCAI